VPPLPANPLTSIHEERLAQFRHARRSLRQIVIAGHVALAIAFFAIAWLALGAEQPRLLFVGVWLFTVDLFATYAARYVDQQLLVLESDDRPLEPFEDDCYEELLSRHRDTLPSCAVPAGARRGADLKALSRLTRA
jgi:hypothetical protein